MIAIIPARGGSKGLPNKNIMLLNGKPLIAYTIEYALKSRHITEVFVSTDSDEIANIARAYGAWVPELRPASLATDDTKSIDVFTYTLELLERKYNKKINTFIALQPTSPLRTDYHIDESIELFRTKKADSVVSFTEENHPIYWNKYIDEEGNIEDVFSGNTQSSRQGYRKTFYPNGAIYILTSRLVFEGKYYSDCSYAYVMDKLNSVDIDTIVDFKYTEFLLNNVRNG